MPAGIIAVKLLAKVGFLLFRENEKIITPAMSAIPPLIAKVQGAHMANPLKRSPKVEPKAAAIALYLHPKRRTLK